MSDAFEPPKDCINWAKDHIAELNRELNAFLNDENACAYVTEPEVDGTYNLLKLKFLKPIPRSVRGHASDAAINLRNALDKVVGCVHSLCGIPIVVSFFPLVSLKSDFKNALKGRCGKLPQDIQHVICLTKPYKGGNDLLWALNKLANTNKHSILRPVVVANRLVRVSGSSGPGVQIFHEPLWNSDKNEAVVARVPATFFTDPNFQMNYESAVFIAFNEIQFIDGKEVGPTLDKFVDIVEGIVMAIEAEARRLGLC